MRNRWYLALMVCVLEATGVVSLIAQSKDGFREFTLNSRTIGTIHGKVGLTITLSMPPDAALDDLSVGDGDGWTAAAIKSGHNVIKITPLKPGAETNMTLILADGEVYTWMLKEGVKGVVPDQQLVAKSADAAPGVIRRQFIPVEACTQQTDAAQREVASLRQALVEANANADDRVAEREVGVRREYALSIRRYHVEPLNKAPFFVRNIWADDEFTYIQLDAPELPAIWELLDGKPNLLNPIPLPGKNGKVSIIRIPKVVAVGKLSMGSKNELMFQVSKVND
jgi:hypothetical protein